MNPVCILAAAATENPITEISRTFGVDTRHFISQVISFGIVAFVLYKFAYVRILNVLEERRRRIEEGLTNADKIKKELAETETARQQIMAKANAQATKLIEEARAAAAKVQETETQRAIAAAEQIIAKAREAAAQDHARMLQELKKEVGQLVVRTTAQVTGKILTMDDQKRLIEDTNKQLAA
ncbi:MAG TPA: F0F1 ATP synthase subunit B [Verrucomicrobiae bacterium]|jgi:F-type H+-transporting ATPase subunit b|nr:F0F1 ATP synthase subunit B [Verrucomicrobiae bacterium]